MIIKGNLLSILNNFYILTKNLDNQIIASSLPAISEIKDYIIYSLLGLPHRANGK